MKHTLSLFTTTALALLAALPSAAAAEPAEAAPAFEAMLKVDAHSHMFEDHPAFHAPFRRLNIQTVNICVNVCGKHLERMHEIAFDLYRQHPQLHPVISTFTLQGCDEPGYTEKVNAWLGRTFERGALGVKIWKEIGLVLKRPDGSFRMPDDALWDPIYASIAKSEKVLYAHLAEPLEAWLPLDKDSTTDTQRLRGLLNEAPQLQHFITEGGFAEAAMMGECGLLISAANTNLTLARAYFEAGCRRDGAALTETGREAGELITELLKLPGPEVHMDGAFDKMFCRVNDPQSMPGGLMEKIPATTITKTTAAPATLSTMPEGLLQSLTAQEAADLLEYLDSLK